MNLTVTIESAELQYKQILEEFFISVYREESLPSHGINHHRRVWKYSKELLSIYSEHHPYLITQLPSKLIIAAYLHDIGMSVETGIRHGKHSKDLCIQFLDSNNLNHEAYMDVLIAVENHDIKEYSESTSENDLLNILSVADDLDAFGFTGIFRYSEIYIKRGIKPEDIGLKIKENATWRYENFVKTFGWSAEYVQKHKARYIVLCRFFDEFNKQVTTYQFGNRHPSGYCGVIDIILAMNKKNKLFKDILMESEKFSHDPVIRWFFRGLASEVS